MQIVVLTGGLFTRTRPESEQVPKSLLLVHGRPLVDWQLDRFVASGARSVIMCVGYLGEEIETHVRRALDRGLVVGYSYDGEQLVGSGGALRRAFARLEDELVVTYGDSYLPFDYAAPLADLRAHPEALATMTVHRGGGFAPSNVAVEGNWVSAYVGGTPSMRSGQGSPVDHVDYGAIALRRSVLADIEDGAVWGLEALWSKLARKRQLRALTAPDRAYEVGSPEGRQELERYLAANEASP
jgi:NDP-sugar pyrophosphorylase family protein